MPNPIRRGQSGSEISGQTQSSNQTPWSNTHFILPYGLRFQQAVGQSTITNISGNGTTVTYTAANNYSAGHQVSIYNVNPNAYNLQNVTVASTSSTQFTVTNSATGTYVSGGVVQKTGTTAVTIPAGITFVYAICVGGGGGEPTNQAQGGGGGGGVAWGWTLANSSSFIGAGGLNQTNATSGGYTRYGNIIAGGGGASTSGVPFLGGGGIGGPNNSAGATNYWGIPGGGINTSGSGAGGGSNSSVNGTAGNNGASGISGGGGGNSAFAGVLANVGGNGGNGLTGGGGGRAFNSTLSNTNGVGGKGFNILTGVVTTNTANGTAGGGIAGNASGFTGGLGGGAHGGAGVIYLFY
jgi:hypothetical protein